MSKRPRPNTWDDPYYLIWDQDHDPDDLFGDGGFQIHLFQDGTIHLTYGGTEGGTCTILLKDIKKMVSEIEMRLDKESK